MKSLVYVLLFLVAVFPVFASAETPLQPLTIQLDWFAYVKSAGILVAKERGWYADAGIDLTIKEWPPDTPNREADQEVTEGNADIGVAEGAMLIKARANGAPLKAFAAQFQRSPLCVLSKKSRGIVTPQDLLGKKVGLSSPKTELMLKIILANQQLSYDQITVVQTKGNLQMLIDDEVDAFTGFMNNQVLSMKAKGAEVSYIPAFKYGYDFYSAVLFTTDEMIKTKPDLIQRFLNVTLRGWYEAFKDPEAAAKLVVEKYYPKDTVQQQTESLKIFHILATLGFAEGTIGLMEEQYWQKGIDILSAFQQINAKMPTQDVFTLEFLKNVSFK